MRGRLCGASGISRRHALWSSLQGVEVEVFNIQALVGSTLIYFNLWSLEHTNYLITLNIWLLMKCLILHFHHQRASSPLSKLYLRCVASLWWWNTETYLHEIRLLKLWVRCEQYIYLFNNPPPRMQHLFPQPSIHEREHQHRAAQGNTKIHPKAIMEVPLLSLEVLGGAGSVPPGRASLIPEGWMWCNHRARKSI